MLDKHAAVVKVDPQACVWFLFIVIPGDPVKVTKEARVHSHEGVCACHVSDTITEATSSRLALGDNLSQLLAGLGSRQL